MARPPVRTFVGVPFSNPIGVSLTAGVSATEAQYPLRNLVDGTSKTAWRSVDKVVAIRLDLGYNAPINYVGIIGHNFTVGTMCSVHASYVPGSLDFPGIPPDDEWLPPWFEEQVLNRAFGTRYPNCWVDTRNDDGTPTAARFWQLHVIDNLRPVIIAEIVIGLAVEFEGIISGGRPGAFHTTYQAMETREVLEYGQPYRSASGAVLRKADLSLTLMQEQVAAFHDLYDLAHYNRGRLVVVPDTAANDIWLTEWPALRETTYDQSYLVGTHSLSMVEEMSGVLI